MINNQNEGKTTQQLRIHHDAFQPENSQFNPQLDSTTSEHNVENPEISLLIPTKTPVAPLFPTIIPDVHDRFNQSKHMSIMRN